MTTELHPLRLAVGSHQPGSGKGCAMNVVAWMMDPTNITDYPECADEVLAGFVQVRNDLICTHRGESKFLCVTCANEILPLAFATINTAGADLVTRMRFNDWCTTRIGVAVDRPPYSRCYMSASHYYLALSHKDLATMGLSSAKQAFGRHAAMAIRDDPYFTSDAIAEWHRLAGTTPTQPPQAAVDHAARQMAEVTQ